MRRGGQGRESWGRGARLRGQRKQGLRCNRPLFKEYDEGWRLQQQLSEWTRRPVASVSPENRLEMQLLRPTESGGGAQPALWVTATHVRVRSPLGWGLVSSDLWDGQGRDHSTFSC